MAWPKGSTVGLQAIWYIDGTVLTEDASYTSGELPDSTSNEWPLAAIMWGLIVGVGAVLVARVRFQSRASSPPLRPKVEANRHPTKSQAIAPRMKTGNFLSRV